MQAPPKIDAGTRSWPAQLQLQLKALDNRTRLTGNRHHGPLRVQRPFYPENNGCCHVYILHPPGGLVSGDDVHVKVDAGSESHGLLTTPSSGKVYRGAPTGEWQRQTTTLNLAPGATLEWLPQDTIVYDGARVALDIEIKLQDSSRFIGWEMVCLGRPAGDLPFLKGSVVQTLRVERNGQPILLERMPLEGGSRALKEPWGLDGESIAATLIADLAHLDDATRREALEVARELIGSGKAGATLTRQLLIIRALGSDAQTVRSLLHRLWAALRPLVIGEPASPPRIWNT